MKIPPIKIIFPILTSLIINNLALNSALAWSGYDYDNKSEIDIGEGNLVREGMLIQFYDNKDDDFHNAKVTFIESIAGGTRIQVEDLTTDEERTFIMGN